VFSPSALLGEQQPATSTATIIRGEKNNTMPGQKLKKKHKVLKCTQAE